jgi:hypothetical protein
MISGAGWNQMPANAAATFGDRYRRIPEASAFVLAIVISLASALVTGLLGAWAAIHRYDRANSKADDAAVGLGGLFAIGTFMFVVVLAWLQKLHHPISSRTPSYALLACLILPAAATLLALSEIEGDYLLFLLVDWAVIALFSFASWMVCRRWYERSQEAYF